MGLNFQRESTMHEGHRSRLVGKIKDGGTVYEHELLEILLFNACPRRDLNETAHALIDRFDGLAGVLSARVDELVTVPGIGKNMAEYINCLGKGLSKIGGSNSFAVLKCTSDFKDYILASRAAEDSIEFCMMDKDGRLRRRCSVKSVNGRFAVSENKVLKLISIYNPYGLFVFRSRTDCFCRADETDDKLVGSIFKAAKLCGTRFFDYCVVSEDGNIFSYFVSNRSVFGHSLSGGYHG